MLANGGPVQALPGAVALVKKWRACHAYPINTFQATLRVRLKRDFSGKSIVAQRLKRMPTVVDKLRRERHKNMMLTRMHDIGGVRAVVDSMADVKRLVEQYKDISRLDHELLREYDYIQSPRDEDGYRSIHLIYKYKNKRNPEYDGLLLELQIRTRLQHLWATAVETMGTYLKQPLKSREGSKEWLEFFATTSSAFACMESTAPLPKHRGLSRKKIFATVSAMNRKFQFLDKMSGYSMAIDMISSEDQKIWAYHLIVLNPQNETVAVYPYKRENIEQALDAYEEIESQAADGKSVEAVLVSAGPLEVLRQAYPNFFLDIRGFVKRVQNIVRKSAN